MIGRDCRAFSAFYGAFAVVLAATVVFAAIAASSPAADGRQDAFGDRVADRFLTALLSSTEPRTDLPLSQAFTSACVEAPCGGAPTPAELVRWAGALARDLADTMGARYLLVVVVGGAAELLAGELAPSPMLPLARAELFHPSLEGFVAVTLFLELP